MQKHITSEPMDFDKAAPDAVISQGLRKLIQKSLKKHAQDRQQSMAELVKELEWYV
jgi:hypothetical protein